MDDAARLDAIHDCGVLDRVPDDDLDRIADLAARALDTPVSLVTIVTDDRQVFSGACGLPPACDESRETPLSHSFCQHAVRERRPLVIRDAREDPRVADNPAIRELGVISYLGVPLFGHEGEILGAFCVIDTKPRDWSLGDLRTVREFTALASSVIALQSARKREKSAMDLLIHDLKTPLASIRMATDLLGSQSGEVSETARPLVDSISECTDAALRLVESLARRDRMAGETTPCLSTVIGSVVERYQSVADDKGTNLIVRNGVPSISVISPGWIVERVVENLVSNAVKFTPPGGNIEIAVEEDSTHGIIFVSDNGPGFSADDLRYLFRRYSPLSAMPTGGEESTGLGLSIVKRLIEQERGEIHLLSSPGQPARFRVSFLLAR